MINADKLGKRAATRSDAEFAAEEARLLDELLASADLSSPTVPEIRSGDQTSDTEASHGQVTWHASAPAPEQPEEQAATVSPSAHIARTFAVPTHTASPTVNVGRPGKLNARYRPWTLGVAGLVAEEDSTDTAAVDADRPGSLDARCRPWTLRTAELVAEEEKPVDDPPAPDDLSSPPAPAPEVRSADRTSDAEAVRGQATRQEDPLPAPLQPEEPVVTVSPPTSSAPKSAGPLQSTRRRCAQPTNLLSSAHGIGPGPFVTPSSSPSRRSRLTSLPPLLTSAPIQRPRFDPMSRRVMQRHLTTNDVAGGAGAGSPGAGGTGGDGAAIFVQRTDVCPHVHECDDDLG